jgi:hypothetical protein
MGEKRQIRRGYQAARVPQGLPARQLERGERIGGGESLDQCRGEPRPLAQGCDIGERPVLLPRGDKAGSGVFGEAINLAQAKAEGRRKRGIFTQRRKGAKRLCSAAGKICCTGIAACRNIEISRGLAFGRLRLAQGSSSLRLCAFA